MYLTDYRRRGDGEKKETVAARYKAQNEEVQSRLAGLDFQGGVDRGSEHYLRRLYRLTIGTRRGTNLTLAVTGRQSTIGSRSDRIGACVAILSRKKFLLSGANASKKGQVSFRRTVG